MKTATQDFKEHGIPRKITPPKEHKNFQLLIPKKYRNIKKIKKKERSWFLKDKKIVKYFTI